MQNQADNRAINPQTSLFREVKKLVESNTDFSEILKLVRERSEEYRQETTRMLTELKRVESLFRNGEPGKKLEINRILIEALGVNSSEHLMLHSKRIGVNLSPFSSFSVAMNLRSRKKQINPYTAPEDYLRSKDDGYRFARKIDVRIPRDEPRTYGLQSLPLQEGIVVKPTNGEGSRGVFIVHSADDIVEVKTATTIKGGFGELRARMADMLARKFVRLDEWISQEVIYEDRAAKIAARDFKFFCFYGKCPLVWEIVRFPSPRACWWDDDKTPADVGRLYAHYEPLNGIGYSDAAMQFALNISKQIPAPFVRIDVMNGVDGPVLGEFTGHPGNFDRMAPKYDRILGEAFLDAENRLFADLMAGKEFRAFHECFSQRLSKVNA